MTAPRKKHSRFNRAIWRKLGKRRYRKRRLTWHGRPTGFYKIEADGIHPEIARTFLREHKKCASIGGYALASRLKAAKQ